MLRQVAISCLIASLVLSAAARTRPGYGGTLRVEVEGDPLQQHGGLSRRLIFDGLTRIGSDGTPQPALAVRWASENSDHRWQFWLRSDVHFSDGSPLTSTVVESSLIGSCGGNCPWTAVHAVGPAIIFTGDSPMPNLPALLAGDDFLIAHAGNNNAGESSLMGAVVGTGVFQNNGLLNGVLTLVANDSCWQGMPFVNKIEISGHKSIRDQWLDLSVGHADVVEVPAEQIRQAQQQHLSLIVSPPVTLLALAVSDSSILSNSSLRASIALAVDRSALSNVIFQKQGEVTASLLPSALTGYSFLFPTDRDLNKAHELRGGLTAPSLTLAAENNPTMQLAAQRLALNLHEAGFSVQVANASTALHKDLALLQLNQPSNQPQAALESMLRNVGVGSPVLENTPAGLYKTEREFLDTHTLIPLLFLPRAYAVSGRVRDLRLSSDGSPLLADVSLGDAQ
ncbi:MAG: ABC transporter substrate-binding protein [Terracidiphilus sp.]